MPPKKSYIEQDGEAAELDESFFREAKPTAEIPELVELLTRHGTYGRPPLPSDARKKRVTLHLDPDVLDRLKSEGKGWQTRANAALRKALGL
jgi:uncharacterized protein (DUF4415 family)